MAIGVNQYQILSPEQANPLGYGLNQGIMARLNSAKAAEQEAKNPYVGKQSLADLIHQQLMNDYQKQVNQFTPEDYKTQFELRRANAGNLGANTSLTNLKVKYPGLGEGGIVGQLAYANLLADHPEIGKRVEGAMGQGMDMNAAMGGAGMGAPSQMGGSPSLIGQPQGQPPVSQTQQANTLAQGIAHTIAQQQEQPNPNKFAQSPNNPLSLLMQDVNADIGGKKALANYRSAGGAAGGVTAKQQMFLQSQLQRDNPNLTPEQAFEAAGNLVQGRSTLDDGTPFNVSGLTQLSAAKAVLQGTTAGLATQGVTAAQAEAEIPVADKYIQEGRKPYGDTIFGKSPQQLADMSQPNNKAAQERLGKYQAAELLQLEKSALALKMAGVESGVSIMNEAMSKANQTISKSNIIQTDKARQVALDTYRKALDEMLKARKSVGVLQSGITGANVGGQNRGMNGAAGNQFSHLSDEELQRIANGQ